MNKNDKFIQDIGKVLKKLCKNLKAALSIHLKSLRGSLLKCMAKDW